MSFVKQRPKVIGSSTASKVQLFVYLLVVGTIHVRKMKSVESAFLLSTTPRRRIGEWSYSYKHSSTLALEGGEWSASRPGHFTPRERAPGTHWIGGWMGPRAVLDAVVKRKIPSPRREISLLSKHLTN
jgi:hypothetical protein